MECYNIAMKDIIGYVAALFTTFSLLPQIIRIWKLKEARDISLFMPLMVCYRGHVMACLWHHDCRGPGNRRKRGLFARCLNNALYYHKIQINKNCCSPFQSGPDYIKLIGHYTEGVYKKYERNTYTENQ